MTTCSVSWQLYRNWLKERVCVNGCWLRLARYPSNDIKGWQGSLDLWLHGVGKTQLLSALHIRNLAVSSRYFIDKVLLSHSPVKKDLGCITLQTSSTVSVLDRNLCSQIFCVEAIPVTRMWFYMKKGSSWRSSS